MFNGLPFQIYVSDDDLKLFCPFYLVKTSERTKSYLNRSVFILLFTCDENRWYFFDLLINYIPDHPIANSEFFFRINKNNINYKQKNITNLCSYSLFWIFSFFISIFSICTFCFVLFLTFYLLSCLLVWFVS